MVDQVNMKYCPSPTCTSLIQIVLNKILGPINLLNVYVFMSRSYKEKKTSFHQSLPFVYSCEYNYVGD